MSEQSTVIPTVPADLERTFLALVERWKEERGVTSFVNEMINLPSYHQIITLGPGVIPLLLRELERDPDYWFAALRRLTGANPVAAEDSGNLQRMAEAWIAWGRKHGYGW